MSMKPGCVVYNPEGRSWCVLVETVNPDGGVRRFMSYHESHDAAQLVKDAHECVYKDRLGVKISMFEYDYFSDDQEIVDRLIVEGAEDLMETSQNE